MSLMAILNDIGPSRHVFGIGLSHFSLEKASNISTESGCTKMVNPS
jgi:hypothetical protein